MPSSSAVDVDWRRASWSAQFDEARACQRLDDELDKLVWDLRRHANSLERTLRCRVLRWCAKFEAERESPALVWKRGRNEHARALLCGLRTGRLAAPFDAGPPDEPLGAGLSSACAAAVGMHRGRAQQITERAGEARKKKRTATTTTRPPLVPGTASLRLAPPQLPVERRGEGHASSADAFARAELPSRVELAASLGSARERIAELEWRLGERERGARAREWEGSVAAARASAALLSSLEEERSSEERRPLPKAAASASASVPASPQVFKIERMPPSPLPPKRAAEAAAAAGTPRPPLPQLRRPKASAAPVLPTPQQRKQKQQTLIPSVSLEELSRRISALAPQQ